MGELYEKLVSYGDSDYYPYHMPGHKRRLAGGLPEELIKTDITEIDGFDNLHNAQDVLKRAQEKAAQLYGAEESFFLVNGSTCGILSAVSCAVPMGGRFIMARNCHKAAYHAAYLRSLQVSFLYPSMLEDLPIFDAVTPKEVEEALDKEPDAAAVLIVSPTYEGRIADIAAIADIVHKQNKILIVDEAHGAHLGFAEGFAQNSVRQGADLVIHSVHKTLPALTQSALLHVCGERVDRNRLKRFLHIYQSSSPSYVLMAGIENALEIVEQKGNVLFKEFKAFYHEMLCQLSSCKRLRFLTGDFDRQDVGKLVILTDDSGISGQKLYDLLLEKYHMQLEMAAETYGLAMFTIGDTKEGYERMTKALLEIDAFCQREYPDIDASGKAAAEKKLRSMGLQNRSHKKEKLSDKASGSVSLCEAWDSEKESVLLEQAVGRAVAEFVNLYPPGVPLLVPGEMLTEGLLEDIKRYMDEGLNVQGPVFTPKGPVIECICESAKK